MPPRPRARLLVALGVISLVLFGSFGTAGAQEDESSDTSARGTLRGEMDGERSTIGGVTIVILQDDEEVGSTETGEDGAWQIDLPGAGTYLAELDVGTLPDGVDVPEGREPTVEFDARAGRTNGVALTLTSADRPPSSSRIDRLGTLFGQGLRLGLVLALSALGLSLVFGVTGLINFAHGELITFGGFVAWYLNVEVGLHVLIAGPIAFFVCALFGFVNERGLWSPLRRRSTSRISLIVISIGLAIVLRYLYILLFGGGSHGFVDYTGQVTVDVGPLSLPPKDYAIVGISLVVLLLVSVGLQRSRFGMAARAVADDRDLAESSGIDVGRVILVVWIVGAALAGLAGVLHGLTTSVQWNMGFNLLLLTFAAVILGGIGTAYGAMLGGVVIGVMVQMSTYWIDSDLKVAVALGLLSIALLFRPQGLLGVKERIG